MRNEPPISTSSPRETMTSPPSASEFNASRTAAALLLTTMVEMAVEMAAELDSAGRGRTPPSTRSAFEELLEQPVNVDVALPALAGRQIEFEIGIGARRGADVIERSGSQRRASQIGVQDHAGGVDHAAAANSSATGEVDARPLRTGRRARGPAISRPTGASAISWRRRASTTRMLSATAE